MKNFRAKGGTITFTASGDVSSGDGVAIGSLLGVAAGDVANGEEGTADIRGVYELPKATGVSFQVGQRLIWDVDASRFIASGADEGDLDGCAVAHSPADSDADTVEALLCPGSAVVSETSS